LLFLGYEGDSLVGVVTLASDLLGRNIGFLASTTADYCDFLSAPKKRSGFVDAVFAELAKYEPEQIILANLPEDSATAAAVRLSSEKHVFRVLLRPAYTCSQVQLGTGEQRQELKTTVMRKKMLQRKLRALERAGRVTYAHLHTWDEIRPALQIFVDAHIERFRTTGRVSPLATAHRRHFIEDLAKRFSDSGVVVLSILMVNGQPAAWNYGFQFHGSWFWYQPTFDGNWEEFSPGYVLLARIITEACDADTIRCVDLGLGYEDYKERFGNSVRQTLHVTASKSWRRHLLEVARYRATALLSRSPRIETAVRRLLGR
jgi:CelD/BcsL family acetyltransferase involved in cellulose biosynthesis